jgi:hypothetical protein
MFRNFLEFFRIENWMYRGCTKQENVKHTGKGGCVQHSVNKQKEQAQLGLGLSWTGHG